MTRYHLEFSGYNNYDGAICDELKRILFDAFKMNNSYFNLAVNEAVCNVAKHSVEGADNVHCFINILVSEVDVSVRIRGKTIPFDAKEFQKRLQTIRDTPQLTHMEWGDYLNTVNLDMGMGFWYMLTGVDYLCIERDGSEIMLTTMLPCDRSKGRNTTINYLVPRFLVRDKGVIS